MRAHNAQPCPAVKRHIFPLKRKKERKKNSFLKTFPSVFAVLSAVDRAPERAAGAGREADSGGAVCWRTGEVVG